MIFVVSAPRELLYNEYQELKFGFLCSEQRLSRIYNIGTRYNWGKTYVQMPRPLAFEHTFIFILFFLTFTILVDFIFII